MKQSSFLKALSVGCVMMFVLMTSCGDESKPTPPPANPYTVFTMVYPNNTSNLSFKVGDTVIVKYGIPNNWPYTKTRVFFSPNNGVDEPELTTVAGLDAIPGLCTYQWIIASSQVGTQCYIRVQDYQGNVSVQSDSTFAVTLN